MELNLKMYRLANYVISVSKNEIIACEYIYFQNENIIREISHPAEISENNQLLIIRINNMHGKDTKYNVNEFVNYFKHLSEWDKTDFYQLYDNDKNEKYITNANMLIRHSRLNIEAVK